MKLFINLNGMFRRSLCCTKLQNSTKRCDNVWGVAETEIKLIAFQLDQTNGFPAEQIEKFGKWFDGNSLSKRYMVVQG